MLETAATWGGVFVLFAFVHFVVDWVFQSHDTAMAKSTDPAARAAHCIIYALGFIPLMILLHFQPGRIIAGYLILLVSHFIEDTYLPVYLWAKHVRRIPEVRERGIEGFKEQFKSPLGLVLFIAIDQIIHLLFLWPLVALALLR